MNTKTRRTLDLATKVGTRRCFHGEDDHTQFREVLLEDAVEQRDCLRRVLRHIQSGDCRRKCLCAQSGLLHAQTVQDTKEGWTPLCQSQTSESP